MLVSTAHTEELRGKNVPVYLQLEGTGYSLILTEGIYTIGVGDVDIRLSKDDVYISDHQSTLEVRKNPLGEWCLYIQDSPTAVNLTRINGWPCKDEFNYQLFDGDIVRMGMTYIIAHVNN